MPMVMAPMPMVVTMVPAAMVHHFGARDSVGCRIDAAADSGRHRRRGHWRCQRERCTGQSHQQELAHGLSSKSPRREIKEAPNALNRA
jgi:hypothetical protein